MTTVAYNEPLKAGEYLQCQGCKSVFGDGQLEDDECPSCEKWGLWVKHRASPAGTVADRLPYGLHRAGWTAMPNPLYRHASTLGLDVIDVGLLSALASFQEPVSFRKLASYLAVSEDTVGRRVNRWVVAGLAEKHRKTTPRGGNAPSEITTQGLHRALALIAENRRAGLPSEEGLAELMTSLRSGQPLSAADPTRTQRVTHSHSAAPFKKGGSRRGVQEPGLSDQSRSDDRERTTDEEIPVF